MKDLALIVIHILATTAKLLGPGGLRAVMIENALLRQQLIVLRRTRRRAPNLTTLDRFLFGFGLLFLSGKRIHKLAIVLQPSTLLKFHDALARGKYRRLFSSSYLPKKPGPIKTKRRTQIAQPSVRLPKDFPDHLADVRYRY